jgi:photosystem II stability/assembly factor-like uncharacterized protein
MLGMTAGLLLGLGTIMRAQEGENHASLRLRYLYEERRYPFAEIPPGALQAANRQMEAQFGLAARRSVFNATRIDGTPWTPIGPLTIDSRDAGRVTALAINRVNPQIIYAGAAQGGVWKTINGGQTWVPLSDSQCSIAVGSIVLDPVNPDIIYVGSGEQNNSQDSYYGCGVLRSTNGGLTWTQLGASDFAPPFTGATTTAARIGAIVIDPRGAGNVATTTLIVSSSRGIFRSTNGGTTWTRTFTSATSAVVLDPLSPNTAYMAVAARASGTTGNNGIYKSSDNGQSWTQLDVNFPAGSLTGRIELAISKSSPLTLYAAVEDLTPGSSNINGLLGIWRTVNGGSTWEQRTGTSFLCAKQCWYNSVLLVDPVNPDRVYYGGLLMNRSEDGAAVFTTMGFNIHVDQHALAFTPDGLTLYVGNDGGVYRTVNPTSNQTSWTSLNTNLAITQFYGGVALHPTNPLSVIGGTQDNGTVEYSGTGTWREIIGGDGGFTAINPLDPRIAWGETQWSPDDFGGGSWGPRRRNTATSSSFSLRRTGIDFNDNAQFIPPLVMHPTVPRILYFGTTKLYRTIDDGLAGTAPWQVVNAAVGRTTGTATAIGVAPSDTAVIYVGSSDGNVLVSSDFGETWAQRISGIPNRVVKDFAVDPLDGRVAIAVVSGFNSGHVFRTTNAGVSWTDISANLPNIPVNAVAIIPQTNEIVIGTDLGVFHSVNTGASWLPFMEGFPNVAVFDLAYNATTRLLVAATHGRGMFQHYMAEPVLRGDVNADGKVTAADAQLVLAASAGLAIPGGISLYPRGDANCDGVTSTVDAQMILAYIVRASTGTGCAGTVR